MIKSMVLDNEKIRKDILMHSIVDGEILFNGINEELIIHYMPNNSSLEYMSDKERIHSQKIGTIFCDILNRSNEIVNILVVAYNNFIERIEENKISDKEIYSALVEITEQLIVDLVMINPCLQIVDLKMAELRLFLSQDLNNRSINHSAFAYERFSVFCKTYLEIYIGVNIECIKRYQELIYNNFLEKNDIFVLPKDSNRLLIPDGYIQYMDREDYSDVQHKKITTQKQVKYYGYHVKTLQELLDVSFYQINLENFHIRKCPMCDRCFSSKTRQVFCDNISKINPNKTCNQLKIHLFSKTEFCAEMDVLKDEYKKICQYFLDNSKNNKYSREQKESILKNRKVFMNFIKKVKDKIKAFTDNEEKCNEYLKLYENYLKKVYDEIYEKKSFNIIKITKNYLPKFDLKYKDIKS